MAEILGRNMVLSKDSTAIAGVRTRSFTINNSPVDITSDDSSGWREFLTEPGDKNVEISVSGVATDDTLLTTAMSASDISGAFSLAWDGNTLSGTFVVASFAQTGEYNGAVTFEATLQSAGAVTLA
jgi:TP901-1 family phage major tail protein